MVLGHPRESGFTKTKNSTNEASMLLKTRDRSRNEAKKLLEINELFKIAGNEAKKLLKTNHITLLSGADYARLARKLAQI